MQLEELKGKFEQFLRQRGYKVTKGRFEIIDKIANYGPHFEIEELVRWIANQDKSIASRSTVYRTVIRLLQQYGSVENILRNWEDFLVSFPQAKKEDLELALALLELHTVEGLDFDEESLKLKEPNIPTLKRKFEELEMKSLIKELENLSQRVAQKSLF